MDFSQDELRLAAFFVEREGKEVLARIRSADLVAEGLLDSLDMVSLAVFIEREFGVKLELADPATFQGMRRFDSLCGLVIRR